MKPFRVAIAGVLAFSLSFTLGCGGSSGPGSPPPVAPRIISQPQNQSTPLSQAATFKVIVSGTAPLSYQWSKDATPIQGATGDSYTTPPVAVEDSGSTYSVTVTNSVSSVTSQQATLTVGPRSPQARDLRFSTRSFLLFRKRLWQRRTRITYSPTGQAGTVLHQLLWIAAFAGRKLFWLGESY
jgi:hypothetical protein